MRFGRDVAQQRMAFNEVVDRVRFGENLGFDGAWGFDHYVPMYGEGPGECFEGMTTLAALATANEPNTSRPARHRGHLQAPPIRPGSGGRNC